MSIRALHRLRRPLVLAALVAIVHGCAPAPALVVPAPAAPARPSRPPQLPAAWTYWEPVDATVTLGPYAPALPLSESKLAIDEGAVARWAGLSPAAREAVLEDGVAVTEAVPGARFAEAYAALAAARVPYVVTMDALFWIAHVARDRALAAAEEAVLAPSLGTLLRRLETRLGADARTAPPDLLAGYDVARGVVSVARALSSPASYRAPTDLARAVAEETRRIAAHAGPAVSPMLGVTVDYSQIVPRGAADASAARTAYALATAWLGAAPFAIAAQGEAPGAELSYARARASTRAALLLARLVDFDVDAESAYEMRRWVTASELSGGTSDDVSPRELLDVAAAVGMDGREPRSFVDVAKIDRLRHALLGGRAAKLDDGGAIAGVPTHRGEAAPSSDYVRAATSVRFFPARGTADADVLQALVYPSVGKLDVHAHPGGGVPGSARGGLRAMPRALDVAVWLGAPDARALLHDAGDDAYERFDASLAKLLAGRPAEVTRHDSIYASSLDAIATYLAPSAADATQPGATSLAWRERKLEAALAAWTTLRHDALPFARFPLATAPAPSPAPSAHAPAPPVAIDLPAFVEPHVEAIAQLLALVRQSSRGLRAVGEVPDGSPAIPILDASERLLADALAIAKREAQDEPLSPAEREAMASFPSRLTELEAKLAPSRAADVSLAVDVHTDLGSARALVEACGDLDDVTLVMREPRTGRLVVAAGVAASHYELAVPASQRLTDATWRARLHATPPPARDAFVKLLPLAVPEASDAGASPDAAATDPVSASPY